jgi:hypothetical protein
MGLERRSHGFAYVKKDGTVWQLLWWGFLDYMEDPLTKKRYYGFRDMAFDCFYWPSRKRAITRAWVCGPIEVRKILSDEERDAVCKS